MFFEKIHLANKTQLIKTLETNPRQEVLVYMTHLLYFDKLLLSFRMF